MTQINVDIFCSVHTYTQNPHKSLAGKSRTTSVLLAGYLGTSMTTPTPSIAYCLSTSDRSGPRTHTQRSPTRDLSPVTTVTWLQRAETPFIRKPEALLWQSWGTARDWPLCIFSSSLAVAHPNCRGCQSLTSTPTSPPPPTSVWLCRKGITRGAFNVNLIGCFQVEACFLKRLTPLSCFSLERWSLFSCSTWTYWTSYLDVNFVNPPKHHIFYGLL